MKHATYLLGIVLMLTFVFSSCKKNQTDNDTVKGMNDLIISDNFDWKTTKTVDVIIILPFDDFSQIVNIFSDDGEQLYYSGYATTENILSTIITIPTTITNVKVVYGFDQSAEPKLVEVGDNLVFNFNTNKSILNGEGVDDCGCDGGIFSLTMRYAGSTQAYIKVIEQKNDVVIYCGTVAPDADFTITGGSKKDGRFDNTIYFYVDDVQNTTMHVSCSVPLEAGDVYNDFIIIAGISKNNLPLCGTPPPPPPPPPPAEPPVTTTVNFDGCLAYEDLWPSKGDYDFNDLIIDYYFSVTKDDQDQVLNITGVFTVYAFGASFHNGFGYMLPNVNPNQIISVSGYNIQSGSIFSLASNGLEANQTAATVIVYDDSYNILTHPGGSIGVNTEDTAPYVAPDSVVVQLVFFDNGSFAPGGPITFADLDIGNFNPFIIVNQDRDVEVHLLDFAPSDLADQTILGTFDDDSDASQQRYYTTSNNLPWAINIPIVFEYPIEKQEVIGAYLKFAEWAESGGTISMDWYEDIAGYRDDSKIYTPPVK
ncbi:MAG: LruC domain-containing protein [Bacteroidetes bacterium]|nr:LruC domain-containing protein [Bacteroidota bacterium]MBL6944257.1 LruC domain-containing protein [Bacteroidales bacterium]